ncbi:MAG: acyl-[Lachnospiraceae bacterium]|nr:acyl-[acyl-carrier-protein] thioesterase [Lachnospiraceae bacterium]
RKFIGNRNYVLKDEEGQVRARADSIWALYDMKKGFPASMTKEELEAFEIEPRLDMEELSRKIKVAADFSLVDRVIVGRDRLDTNIHVNNGQYIKLGCNYVPEDRDLSRVRVEYKTSIKLGDEVSVLTCEKDGLFYVRFDDAEGNEYSILEFGFK